MSIWRWADWVEEVPERARITLGEGDTPVVHSRRIGPEAGLANLVFKVETSNPSGSYKDRFAAAAVSAMVAGGKRRCIATSSGNTGSALAAYCAAAGIDCEIAIVETAPSGKLSQMLAYGARLYRIHGFGPDPQITRRSFECIERLGAADDAALQISAYRYSPLGMSGVQTISYELADQLPQIDHVFCPAGGGGLTLAVARGFAQLVACARLHRSPAIECVQPAGNDTIATPLRSGEATSRAVRCTTTISGLQVPSILDGDGVIAACRDSGGSGHGVDDASVFELQARLAREEGIFCEPAGAVALAGALDAAAAGRISRDAVIVCLVTGSGFKDPTSVTRMIADASCPTFDITEVEQRLEA